MDMHTSSLVFLVVSLATSAFACGVEADSEMTAEVAANAARLGFTLRSAHTANLCLHVVNGSSADGAQIDIESCDGPQLDHAKIWNNESHKTSAGDTFVRIRNYHSGKCLSLPVAANQSLVVQTTCGGTDATQDWIQIPGDFGGSVYANVGVGTCLHTRDSSATSGARVEVAPCSFTDHAQDWIGTAVFP
jgi:hypothetical protein